MSKKGVTITTTQGSTKATLDRGAGASGGGGVIKSKPTARHLTSRSRGNVIETNPEIWTKKIQTLSALVARMQLAQLAGLQYDGNRNLYTVFGYQKSLTPDHFLAKYNRQDIASRIIDAPPSATWSNPPEVQANDGIVKAWNEIVKTSQMWGAMYRADRLSRMNPFSLLIFGFDDRKKLDTPVTNAKKLNYVRTVGARQVHELEFEADTSSPRFGLPKMYQIKFDDPKTKSASAGQIKTSGLKDLKVHWSRVVHVTENPLEDMAFSTPMMEKVYNLLDDLLKVAGGTAEMFWLSGRGGIQADIDKDMDIDPADAAALSEEMDEYMHEQRRVIRTRGVKLNVLNTKPPDPSQTFNVIISLISGTTGIPRRILLGSEAGQLASEQDRANWAERITERRALGSTPGILVPTMTLFQTLGLVPTGDTDWKWPSAFIQNPLEEGQTMAQFARAIGNMSRQTGNQKPMQITSREEAREIIGLEGDLAESDIFVTEDDDDNNGPQGNGKPSGSTREDKTEKIKDEKDDE